MFGSEGIRVREAAGSAHTGNYRSVNVVLTITWTPCGLPCWRVFALDLGKLFFGKLVHRQSFVLFKKQTME